MVVVSTRKDLGVLLILACRIRKYGGIQMTYPNTALSGLRRVMTPSSTYQVDAKNRFWAALNLQILF